MTFFALMMKPSASLNDDHTLVYNKDTEEFDRLNESDNDTTGKYIFTGATAQADAEDAADDFIAANSPTYVKADFLTLEQTPHQLP